MRLSILFLRIFALWRKRNANDAGESSGMS